MEYTVVGKKEKRAGKDSFKAIVIGGKIKAPGEVVKVLGVTPEEKEASKKVLEELAAKGILSEKKGAKLGIKKSSDSDKK